MRTGRHEGDWEVVALASSPHLTRLSSLNLRACHFGPEPGLALARSRLLSGLEIFRIGYCDLGPEAAWV